MTDDFWSVPPVTTDDAPGRPDRRIFLDKGVVTEVIMDSEWLFQNVNENEDDVIEFSFHGDPKGTWGVLNTHSLVRAKTTMFFLNRTHKDISVLAVFRQNSSNF